MAEVDSGGMRHHGVWMCSHMCCYIPRGGVYTAHSGGEVWAVEFLGFVVSGLQAVTALVSHHMYRKVTGDVDGAPSKKAPHTLG